MSAVSTDMTCWLCHSPVVERSAVWVSVARAGTVAFCHTCGGGTTAESPEAKRKRLVREHVDAEMASGRHALEVQRRPFTWTRDPFLNTVMRQATALDVFCVPFDSIAWVQDSINGRPFGKRYQERFLPGAFRSALADPTKLKLYFDHHEREREEIGYAYELAETKEGLVGAFVLRPTERAELALDLVLKRSREGASISFKKGVKTTNPMGVIEHHRVTLTGVSLVDEGAYPAARVTGIRHGTGGA